MKKKIRNKYLVLIKEYENITYEQLGNIFGISRQRAKQIYDQNQQYSPTLVREEGSQVENGDEN